MALCLPVRPVKDPNGKILRYIPIKLKTDTETHCPEVVRGLTHPNRGALRLN